jgi:hypothetical protein
LCSNGFPAKIEGFSKPPEAIDFLLCPFHSKLVHPFYAFR